MKKILGLVLAVFAMLWVACTTIVESICILVLYGIGFLLPRFMRLKITRFLSNAPYYWVTLNRPILNVLGAKHWAKKFPQGLDPQGIYLIIANHQSWSDILVLSTVLNRKTTPIKFFMKKELKWQLPIIGLACKAVGFPMLSRHTKAEIKKNPKLKNKDKQSTVEACEFVKKHPASLIIFPEGSRLTVAKLAKQLGSYKNLLKPKAGGAAMSINGIDESLKGVIDVTIDYGECGKTLSFWKFLEGRYKNISVDIKLLSIDDSLKGDYEKDRIYRKHIQAWLSERWRIKDEILSKGGVSE